MFFINNSNFSFILILYKQHELISFFIAFIGKIFLSRIVLLVFLSVLNILILIESLSYYLMLMKNWLITAQHNDKRSIGLRRVSEGLFRNEDQGKMTRIWKTLSQWRKKMHRMSMVSISRRWKNWLHDEIYSPSIIIMRVFIHSSTTNVKCLSCYFILLVFNSEILHFFHNL